MPQRESSIKVTLNEGSAIAGLNSMKNKAKKTGKEMGKGISEPLKKGFQGAQQAFSDMAGSIKSGLQTALSLGGAVSFGAAIAEAREGEQAYLQLAYALSTYGDNATSAAQAQEIVTRVADKTRTNLTEVRKTLMQLSSAAKHTDIAPLLEAATNQARRMGLEGEFMARVYTRLVAKGVTKTADETENLVEQMNKMMRTMLGIDIDEALDPMDVAELSAFINRTGNEAAKMFKLISMGGKDVSKDFGQINTIVEELGLSLGESKGINEMRKKLKLGKKVITSQKTALENMLAIAAKGPKVFDKMADAMAGDFAGKALKQIVGEELLVNAKAGKIKRKEWNLRIEGLRQELENVKGFTTDRAKIEQEDAKHKKTLAADLDAAMNDIKKAFSSPEMVKALKEMAKHLPTMVDGITKFISWVMENPLTAVAGGAALKVGGGLVGGLQGYAFGQIGKELEKKIQKSAADFEKRSKAGGASFVNATSRSGKNHISAMEKGGALLSAALAGVAIGTAIHEGLTGPQAERAAKKKEMAEDAAFKARGTAERGTLEEKMAALKKLQQAKKDAPGAILSAEGVMGTMASLLTDVESPMEQLTKQQVRMAEAESALIKSIAAEVEQRKQEANVSGEFTKALRGATQMLKGMQPVNVGADVAPTARGTKALPNQPGSAPVRG